MRLTVPLLLNLNPVRVKTVETKVLPELGSSKFGLNPLLTFYRLEIAKEGCL